MKGEVVGNFRGFMAEWLRNASFKFERKLGFFGFPQFCVFEVDLLIGDLEDSVFDVGGGREGDLCTFCAFDEFFFTERVGDFGAEGGEFDDLAEDDFEWFGLGVFDVGEDDDGFDVCDAAVLDLAFFDFFDFVGRFAAFFDGEALADLGEGRVFFGSWGGTLDLEIVVVVVGVEFQAEFVFEDLFEDEFGVSGRETLRVFRVAFAREFFGIGEAVVICVDVGDVLASDIEAVAVEPLVVDGRADLFGVWREDGDDGSVDGFEDWCGDEETDWFTFDDGRFEVCGFGEAGERGVDAFCGFVFSEVGVLADFIFRGELGVEGEDLGDEEAACEEGDGSEGAEEEPVVFSFEPFHGRSIWAERLLRSGSGCNGCGGFGGGIEEADEVEVEEESDLFVAEDVFGVAFDGGFGFRVFFFVHGDGDRFVWAVFHGVFDAEHPDGEEVSPGVAEFDVGEVGEELGDGDIGARDD